MNFNAILFLTNHKITIKEKELMQRFGIGDNIFKESPDWLRSWACLVLKSILSEKEELYGQVLNCSPDIPYSSLSDNQKSIKSDIEDLYFQRIHNFLVSIDKAQHFLSKQQREEHLKPPVYLVGEAEQMNFYVSMLTALTGSLEQISHSPQKVDKLNIFL